MVRRPTESHVRRKSGSRPIKEMARDRDTLLLHTTNRKYHMAHLFVPFPITVDDLEGHSPNPRIGMPNNISVVKGATKLKLSRRRRGFSLCARVVVPQFRGLWLNSTRTRYFTKPSCKPCTSVFCRPNYRRRRRLSRLFARRHNIIFSSTVYRCFIFTVRRYASAVLAMGLCPSVSVCVCHKPVFY